MVALPRIIVKRWPGAGIDILVRDSPAPIRTQQNEWLLNGHRTLLRQRNLSFLMRGCVW